MTDALQEKRKQNKERYDRLKGRGMCVKCGRLKAEEGHSLCLVCRMDMRGNVKTRTDEEKVERAAKQRQRVAQHKAAGLCVSCDRPAYANHVHCYEHHVYHNKKSRERRRTEAKGFGAIGLCRICGKEPAPGKKLCPEHSRQYAERITKRNKERASGVRRD